MTTSRNLLIAAAIGLAAVSSAAQTQRSSISLVPPNPTISLVEQLMISKEGGNRIIGTAIDSRRSPIAKARLQLRNLQSGQIVQETEANLLGEYAFARVEPGTYVVELHVAGAVVALSDATTLSGGELVQTLIQIPGRWDTVRQAVVPEIALSQFVGASAADTMASETLTTAAGQGITSVDAGEPVSGQ